MYLGEISLSIVNFVSKSNALILKRLAIAGSSTTLSVLVANVVIFNCLERLLPSKETLNWSFSGMTKGIITRRSFVFAVPVTLSQYNIMRFSPVNVALVIEDGGFPLKSIPVEFVTWVFPKSIVTFYKLSPYKNIPISPKIWYVSPISIVKWYSFPPHPINSLSLLTDVSKL